MKSVNTDFLAKIKGLVSIRSKKKTSNILDGEFHSLYKGRSLEFDELREYAPGDNIRDIDWKTSSRIGKTMVRKYIAEKKHNILFVADTGTKMDADTSAGDSKADVALDIYGTIAYLTDRQSDEYALIDSTPQGYDFSYFRSGRIHFEELAVRMTRTIRQEPKHRLAEVLNYVAENIRRRMIIVIITDLDGLDSIQENLLRKLTVNNDVLVANIDDAYLYGDQAYDTDRGMYEDDFLLHSPSIRKAEIEERARIKDKASKLFRKYGVACVNVTGEKDVVEKIIDLFERQSSGNFG
ncbi:MAG: DUF58 domain-containing protein [Eubacterium sp.]|nr:DUF58 domain-containing protein [Eubacterium sp.]